MPIYEYACTACDHRTDILHGLNDPGPLFCPSCGEEGTMRKLFAPPTIHFKGSGWAKKDRGSSSGSRSSASAKSSADGGSSSGDKAASSDSGTDSGSSGSSGDSGSSGSASSGSGASPSGPKSGD
jgi:putative FmdB family regulatory protein